MTDPRAPAFQRARDEHGSLSERDVKLIHSALDGVMFPRAQESVERPSWSADNFYTHLRKFIRSLNQTQVNVINGLLTRASHWPVGWLAYGLATAWHECRLEPIDEMGGPTYFKRMYDINGDRPAVARRLGNTEPGDGALYHGRGLVQLTGRANYKKAGEHLGTDLVTHPDLAKDPDIASAILVWGMESGIFTGVSLGKVIGRRGTHQEFVKARSIINGTDKAALIAEYAEKFQEALENGGWHAA